jgi:hypothetical protein
MANHDALFEKLKGGLHRIEIDGRWYWRLEGDLLLDEEGLLEYAQRQAQALPRDGDFPLIANVTAAGKIIRWASGVTLTWTALRKTFVLGGDDGYELAVRSVRAAAAAWEETCGVEFEYKPELDGSADLAPQGALFTVREHDTGGKLIAAAFFPQDPSVRRRVIIDPSFYQADLSYDRVGVLRHELGHVLGFRHEHIRSGKPPQCPDEDTYGTKPLNDEYDPRSVMHYFCGGLGSKELAITDLDRTGAQKVYGPPLKNFQLVRP